MRPSVRSRLAPPNHLHSFQRFTISGSKLKQALFEPGKDRLVASDARNNRKRFETSQASATFVSDIGNTQDTMASRPEKSAMAKIICLFNHKGGVSKTTTAFNLGWMMA